MPIKNTYFRIAGFPVLILVMAIQIGCRWSVSSPEKTIQEIKDVEQAFMTHLQKHGAADAFATFAAPDAVIKREKDSLIQGPQAIRAYYEIPVYKNAHAEWSPTKVSVSDDGNMAWTYGPYQWTIYDSTGKESRFSGIFHTIWKRQADGSWKYVWD